MQPASYGVMESQPVSTIEHVYSGRTLLATPMAEVQVSVLNARAQEVPIIQGTLLGKVFMAEMATQNPQEVSAEYKWEKTSPQHTKR